MMGHGKHDNCMVCIMGKNLGMIETCTDDKCTNPVHKKEKEQKQKNSNN